MARSADRPDAPVLEALPGALGLELVGDPPPASAPLTASAELTAVLGPDTVLVASEPHLACAWVPHNARLFRFVLWVAGRRQETPVYSRRAMTMVAPSRDGTHVVVAGDSGLSLWQVGVDDGSARRLVRWSRGRIARFELLGETHLALAADRSVWLFARTAYALRLVQRLAIEPREIMVAADGRVLLIDAAAPAGLWAVAFDGVIARTVFHLARRLTHLRASATEPLVEIDGRAYRLGGLRAALERLGEFPATPHGTESHPT